MHSKVKEYLTKSIPIYVLLQSLWTQEYGVLCLSAHPSELLGDWLIPGGRDSLGSLSTGSPSVAFLQ